jgi:hypothetical protein
MERMFSPCTRLHDILENQGRLGQELDLNVSIEELLSVERAFTYVNLYTMLGDEDTVAWLTPHTAVARKHGEATYTWGGIRESCCFHFSADGKDMVAMALSPEQLSEICDVILRLLAVSVVHSLLMSTYDWNAPGGAVINATTLAYLMEQCQSLKVLSLANLEMDENNCRALGDFSRPGLEIVLRLCTITSAGASALSEVLGRNQGPAELDLCKVDNSVLVEGLRGNRILKLFASHISGSPEDGNGQVLAIADALRENKGLVKLNLVCHGFKMNDEAWGVICNSLKAHPTLEVLNLRSAFRDAAPAPVVLKSRIQALVDMLEVNMSIRRIHLNDRLRHHKLFRGSVIPYLKTNRFRPRLRAIQRTRPIAYRAKVLGRALLAVRTDPNRIWMLLSGNTEVAFPSSTSIATAATIADDANTSTAKVAAAAASVMSTLTTTATGRHPTAAVTAVHATGATSTATSSTDSDTLAFAPTMLLLLLIMMMMILLLLLRMWLHPLLIRSANHVLNCTTD